MKKIFSIALSLLILFGNVGLAKTIHSCMGTEMEEAIGFSASQIECGMVKKKPDCHPLKEVPTHEEKDCCEDEFELLILDQDIQKSDSNLELNHDFTISLVFAFLGITFLPIQTDSIYKDYPPPFLKQDFQVLHQSFLI